MTPFDLQSHSTVSDGTLAPAAVVAAAADAGVALLALTDHDAVDGVDEAVAAGVELGVQVVPAVELTVLDGDVDLHLCGYGIDHRHPALERMLAACRQERTARAWRLADALEACGLQLDRAPLEARAVAGGAVGRPHLAQAVLDHPANAARLQAEDLGHAGAVLEAYLITGRPAFVARWAPALEDGIAVIHEAGGLAVWAHPFYDVADEEVGGAIARFADMGLDGVEAFYVAHSEAQTRAAVTEAGRHGLLTTCSSDFHGPDHPSRNRFLAFERYGLTPDLGPIAAS